MPARAKTRTAGRATSALLSLWLCAAATSAPAQTDAPQASQAINGQVQLGDVIANQSLHVESADDQAAGEAVALGNTASAVGQNADLAFTSTQRVGEVLVNANSAVQVDKSAGDLLNNIASATGNTSTAGTCCGATTGSTSQTVDPGAVIYANGFSNAGALSAQASADSTAIGNTHGWESANGSVDASSSQAQGGKVSADNGVSLPVGTSGEGGYSATAVSNDVSATATNASSVALRTNQTVTGAGTHADVQATQDGGDTVLTQATATGNNVTVVADGGSAALTDAQANDAEVTAQSDLRLNGWNSASASAYGVGNSALMDNTGYGTSVANTQSNTGAVTVAASLTGGSGGEGQVAATAVGNAVSAYACATCNGGVEAKSTQVNSGAIHATSTFTAGAVGSAGSAASAIGNTAAFQVRSPGS